MKKTKCFELIFNEIEKTMIRLLMNNGSTKFKFFVSGNNANN